MDKKNEMDKNSDGLEIIWMALLWEITPLNLYNELQTYWINFFKTRLQTE